MVAIGLSGKKAGVQRASLLADLPGPAWGILGRWMFQTDMFGRLRAGKHLKKH